MIAATTMVACLWFGNCEPPPEPFSPEPLRLRVVELEQAAAKAELAANRGMGNGDVEQWRPLVAGHFEPEDVDTVLCLMGFESGGNPDAQNRSSGASGLMQVMPSWAPKFGVSKADLFKPEVNLYISRKLRDDGGWNHWAPYNRGECH